MRGRLLSLCGLCLAATSVPIAAQRGTGCNSDWPQVGILRLDGPGPVTVYRFTSRVPIDANDGSAICIDDSIPPRPQTGRVDLLSGEPAIPLLANEALNAPSCRRGLLGWLRSLRSRAILLRAGTAGSLGSDEIGFPLAAIATGTAEIGSNYRRIRIPLNSVEIPLVVELWSPGARQPRVVDVTARSGEAAFNSIRPQRGPWRIVIRAERPVVGGFEMVDEVSDPEISALAARERLSPRDVSMALACIDFPRHGLEAYQRLDRLTDRRIILSWQQPTTELSCGTPTRASSAGR